MEYLRECAQKLNIELSNEQLDQYRIFYDMLIETNKVMNLTAITEKKEVIVKHFLDSIAIAQYVDLSHGKIIDIGTGAGFPGIPLKILYPDCEITLLDSLNKRIRFIENVTKALNLSKVTAIHGRAEDYAHQKEYRHQYDFAVSRAVANLSTLSEYCLPFVKTGGQFISYKSGNVDEELEQSKNAIFLCGGKINKVERFRLEEADADRTFVFIKKKMNTSKQYPRKSGTPSKNPL